MERPAMSITSEFYLTRAAECARDASAATLDNVKERYQRSEAAWMAMADRLTRGEAMRETQLAEKAARDLPDIYVPDADEEE
jgi:hypothetical protein